MSLLKVEASFLFVCFMCVFSILPSIVSYTLEMLATRLLKDKMNHVDL